MFFFFPMALSGHNINKLAKKKQSYRHVITFHLKSQTASNNDFSKVQNMGVGDRDNKIDLFFKMGRGTEC